MPEPAGPPSFARHPPFQPQGHSHRPSSLLQLPLSSLGVTVQQQGQDEVAAAGMGALGRGVGLQHIRCYRTKAQGGLGAAAYGLRLLDSQISTWLLIGICKAHHPGAQSFPACRSGHGFRAARTTMSERAESSSKRQPDRQ